LGIKETERAIMALKDFFELNLAAGGYDRRMPAA
jgi:hypothetical protein